jgi:hypothetical protein
MLENLKTTNLSDDVYWTTQASDKVEQEALVQSWRNYLEKKKDKLKIN